MLLLTASSLRAVGRKDKLHSEINKGFDQESEGVHVHFSINISLGLFWGSSTGIIQHAIQIHQTTQG